MNRFARSTACALLPLSLLVLASASRADTAKLSISGRVNPGTCTLVAAPIQLAPLRADELNQGDNAIKTGALELKNCVGVSTATLSFDGTAADGDAERWKNTAGKTPAAGVTIALLSGTTGTTYLKKGDSVAVQVSGDAGKLEIRSGYHLAGPASGLAPGEVSTEITITADYK